MLKATLANKGLMQVNSQHSDSPRHYFVSVKIVVVKPDGPPKLCKTDEVGELCVASGTVGSAYFGLVGKTNHTFKVMSI